MNSLLPLIVMVFLIASFIIPYAYSQEFISDHVVLNEVEINPPGDDAATISEWVELYNPTDEELNIGGWQIASTTVLKKTFNIPDGTIIKPHGFLTFQYTKTWFTDVGELVELRDKEGNVVDATPVITDINNDFKSWQRIYDGYDTDSQSDWKFITSSAGLSNGKIKQGVTEKLISINLESDKNDYLLGETAIISGSVSEKVFIEKPFFQAEKIQIKINGPNYYKEISLFPDLFLKFKTSLKLQPVLGITEGTYTVEATYAGASKKIEFNVGQETILETSEEESSLSIFTDKFSYLPGEYVTIFGTANKIIPLEGLKFQVLDPNGVSIYDGVLFPNLGGGGTGSRGGDVVHTTDTQFSTKIYMNTVKPLFGTYEIIAEYSDQKATTSFDLVEDLKEQTAISLSTDKKIYGLGDVVTISGRLNQVWIPAVDFELQQISSGSIDVKSNRIFKKTGALNVAGDGRFETQWKIANDPVLFGEYRVTVSKEIGSAEVFFKIVENPESFVESSEKPLVLTLDKPIYENGDKIIISGKVNQLVKNSQFYTNTVDIKIVRADGQAIKSATFKPSSGKPSEVKLLLTAVPDLAGNFKVEDVLYKSVYGEGDYVVRASYGNGLYSTSVPFSIIDPLKSIDKFQVNLNKEVFGFGEDVKIDGIIPGISQGTGITIKLIKPNGDIDEFGVLADNSKFSWSWKTPLQEVTKNIQKADGRVVKKTNLGVYHLIISTSSQSTDLFFKLSADPINDSLNIAPLQVSTDKPVYKIGEKLNVFGVAKKRPQGNEGLVVPDRVNIVVETTSFPITRIYDSFVYFDRGGNFEATFDMPVTIFKDGIYKVKASYLNNRAETLFSVENDFVTGGDEELKIIATLDKEEYYPGETVHVTGRPSKIVYLDFVDITIVHESLTQITCGSFVCGTPGKTHQVFPTASGSFTFDYAIPNSSDAKGKYEAIIHTEFDEVSLIFNVKDKPPLQESSLKPRTTEKHNRISDSTIPIELSEKIQDGTKLKPRVLQGLLVSPIRGEESNVNLKVSTEDGKCIIGPDDHCQIHDSTRTIGTIYETVDINGKLYNIRYTGPDARIEKFTILPVSSEETIVPSAWIVEIIKDDQPSRFYYKVTYVSE